MVNRQRNTFFGWSHCHKYLKMFKYFIENTIHLFMYINPTFGQRLVGKISCDVRIVSFVGFAEILEMCKIHATIWGAWQLVLTQNPQTKYSPKLWQTIRRARHMYHNHCHCCQRPETGEQFIYLSNRHYFFHQTPAKYAQIRWLVVTFTN